MNLVFFLTVGSIIMIVLGEFGKFPFGTVGNNFSLLDIVTAATSAIFLVWQIAIKKDLSFLNIQKWLLGFIGIGLLSLVLNHNFSGSMYLVRFGLYSMFFCIAFSLVKAEKKWQYFIENALIVAGLLAAMGGFLQLWFYPNLTFLSEYGYDPHIGRLAGTFLDPNFLGAFLTVVYCLTLIKSLKKCDLKMISLLAIFTTAIVLTFSRSAWLMFLVVNGFAFWFLPKKIIAVLLMLVMLSVVLIPRVQLRLQGAFEVDISASERLSSWDKGLKLFQINPLIGIGYNNVRSVSQENNLLKTFSTDGGNSGAGVDSSWLLVLATTGIMGAILIGYWYINLVVVFLKAFFQSKRRELFILAGLLIAFFINSQFINSLFYPPLMISLFLITGMYFYDVVYKK